MTSWLHMGQVLLDPSPTKPQQKGGSGSLSGGLASLIVLWLKHPFQKFSLAEEPEMSVLCPKGPSKPSVDHFREE